jgi:prolyl oligopeptidase
MMRFDVPIVLAITTLLLTSLAAAASGGEPLELSSRPPIAPKHQFHETLYGVSLSDPYRYMEDLGPETLSWLKAQGAFTQQVFSSIPGRAALQKRIAEFGSGFGIVTAGSPGVQAYQVYAGRILYTEREPGSDNLDLFVRDARGSRKLIDVAQLRVAHGGRPYAINYFQASPDGLKVAAGISEAGSEDTSLWIYDVDSGKQLAGPVDRAQYAVPAWTDDGQRLFFMQLAALAQGDPPTAKYENASAVVWDMHSQPKGVVGKAEGNAGRLHLTPEQFPFVLSFPGSTHAIFENVNGVQNELEYWIAPLTDAATPGAPWRQLVTRADNVTGIDIRDDDIFLLSHQDAPTFKVLALRSGDTLSAARTLVAAKSDRVIESIHAASDGLYVLAREGIYSRLLRVPAGTQTVEEIPLPFKGYISAAFTDPRAAGVTVTLESWVMPPTIFGYNATDRKFTDLKLGSHPAYDALGFRVSDLHASARDGVQVPLTLIEPKDSKGPQVVLLDAYGSYGISLLPEFNSRIVAFMREEAAYAVCHVRGGGELGEAWRLGGKDANKPNTWRDLIACGENLIKRGTTTRDKLFIMGGSAGGITMGRALTERPDLFAGVIDRVPSANPLRSEFSPNGPPNVPEFGSVKTPDGFKNLMAMDSYQSVKDGMQYPAVLITTGLNDPRVASWEPGKFAARIQASATRKPVLLRVDTEAGHGVGSTKTQKDEEFADIATFIFWRAGRPGWQPTQADH